MGRNTVNRSIALSAKLRCLVMDEKATMTPEDRRRIRIACAVLETGEVPDALANLRLPLRELKRRYIAVVLEQEPSVHMAARRLRVHVSTLWRYLKVNNRS